MSNSTTRPDLAPDQASTDFDLKFQPNEWYRNIDTNLIIITEDKLENCLLKHLRYLRVKRMWITPFTLALSLIAALSATKFEVDLFNIPRSVWQAGFYLCTLGCLVWLSYSLLQLYNNRGHSGVSNLIEVIKGEVTQKT